MAQFLIPLTGVLIVAGLAWGIVALLLGQDQGLEPAEPDGRSVPLPSARPLTETDLGVVRFDIAPRGYRMLQVDSALRRAAYDIGYKEELIGVLEAEVTALRDGRLDEAEALRQAREAASRPRTEPESEDLGHEAETGTEGDPVVLGTFALGAGPTIGTLPGEPEAVEGPEAVGKPEAVGEPEAVEEPEAPAVEEPAEPAAGETPEAEPEAVAETEPDAEPEAATAAEPDDSVDGDAGPDATTEPEAEPEAATAAEPDDSVDTDLAPAATAGTDQPARPADGEK